MLSRGRGLTEKGLERPNNEDVLHVDDTLGLYLVCDGAGGNAAGEVASALALRAVVDLCEAERPLIDRVRDGAESHDALGQLARRAVDSAAERVYLAAQSRQAYMGMGTTLTLLIVAGSKAVVAHVGDSRAYLYRDGSVRMVTADHTVAAILARRGEISPAEEQCHPLRNYLTRAIGMRPPISADIDLLLVRPGDRLLLCSDGLSNCLENADVLLRYLTGETDTVPRALFALAAAVGGEDDMTAVVVGIESESQRLTTQSVRTMRRRKLFAPQDWVAQS